MAQRTRPQFAVLFELFLQRRTGVWLHRHISFLAELAVYRKDHSWWRLRQSAGLDARAVGGEERAALENVHELIHVGDERRLGMWVRLASLKSPVDEADRRLARMLFAVLYGKETAAGARADALWAEHALLREEIAGLVPVLRELNAVLTPPHALEPEIPLVLHARYLGVELSAAFDHRTSEGNFRDYYTGVELTHGKKFDLLLVTLDKVAATKEHLRYRDFPLNEKRFHWQSKARTTRESKEGRRHLNPGRYGVMPLLFVRERADERAGVTMAFRYLGPVDPDGADGERPITIEWRLRYAMPREVLVAGRVAG